MTIVLVFVSWDRGKDNTSIKFPRLLLNDRAPQLSTAPSYLTSPSGIGTDFVKPRGRISTQPFPASLKREMRQPQRCKIHKYTMRQLKHWGVFFSFPFLGVKLVSFSTQPPRQPDDAAPWLSHCAWHNSNISEATVEQTGPGRGREAA